MDIRQLLSQGYQAADRFLPFDGLLDPMFAPPPRRMDAPPMPPMQQPMGTNANFRSVPQMGQAPMPQAMPQQQAPMVPRRGGGFGQRLMDAFIPETAKRWDQRDAAAAQEEQQAKFLQFAQTVLTDPREQLVFQANPEEWAKNTATRYAQVKLGKGEAATIGGDTVAYNRDFMEVGPNVFATNPDGTVDKVGTRDLTPEEALKLQSAQEGEWTAVGGHWWRKPPGGGRPEKGPPLTAEPKAFAPPRLGGGGSGVGGSGFSDVPAGAVVIGGQ